MRTVSILAIACLMLAAPAASFAQTATPAPTTTAAPAMAPMIIYDDGLSPGWNSWSWAKVTFKADVHADFKPIAVEGDAWSALALRHAPFLTKGYTKLTFVVNGGTTGGVPITVLALVDGTPVKSNYIVHPQSNTWTTVEVPLADIGAANTTIDGIWLQALTDKPYSTYYVTLLALE